MVKNNNYSHSKKAFQHKTKWVETSIYLLKESSPVTKVTSPIFIITKQNVKQTQSV